MNPVRPEAEAEAGAGVIVDRLFILTRTVAVHGESHPLSLQLAESVVAAMAATGPPFALQFVGQAVFVDRALAVLEPQSFHRALHLARALAAMRVNEVKVEWPPAPAAVLALGAAIARKATEAPAVDGLFMREITGAREGTAGSAVDAELFATAQVTRALADIESLEGRIASGWDWAAAVGAMRRAERAVEADLGACLRFLDFAPGQRTVARRALGAMLHALAMLDAVKVSVASRRVGAHAALTLALHGYSEREGCTFAEAADTALPTLLAGVDAGASTLDAHRLRVCALLHGVCAHFADASKWHPVARAAALAFDLERLRCPLGPDFDLENGDLLAWASRASGAEHDPRWVRALLAAHGSLPPGAQVRLADGRPGVSLGGAPGEDPLRPLVYLHSGTILWPESPVDIALRGE